MVSGNYAYLLVDRRDLEIIDLTDPANPQRVGGYATGYGVWELALAGHYVYLARWDNELEVIDVADPVNPQLVGSVRGDVLEITVVGDRAFVGLGFIPWAPIRAAQFLDNFHKIFKWSHG